MAEKLTKQQQMAVDNRGGNLLVSAAAGSGKTKVLVDRLLSYLTSAQDPAELNDFLIITYTKAAASELRSKIAAKLAQRISEEPDNRHLQKQLQRLYLTQISTIHGFCSELLKEYAYRLDIPGDFHVGDENECMELRMQVLEELLEREYQKDNPDADFFAFVDAQGYGRNDRRIPELVLKVYDSAHCHLNPDGWLDKCIQNGIDESVRDVSETLWGKYLMDNFFDFLDTQIAAMRQCADAMTACSGLDKCVDNILDTVSQMELLRACSSWDEIVAHRTVTYCTLRFPKNVPDELLVARVKAVRTACKEGLSDQLETFTRSSEQVFAESEQCKAACRGLVSLVRQFDTEYSNLKRSRRVLDFSDLEHRTLDLLKGKKRNGVTSIAAEIGSRFREVMVDEYQDSNEVQNAIFESITSQKNNCFMVGDVKQSIYSFRLADPEIFLHKSKTYIPAENAGAEENRKISLSHNFRSGPEIIEAVNSVFRRCMSDKLGNVVYQGEEELREGIPHELLPNPAVELYAIETKDETYAEEAAFTAGRITEMIASKTLIRDGDAFRPVKAEDIVILLRSPNSQGQYYQRALEAEGIRYNTGAAQNLLETEEVSTLRSFLQTIANPQQDIPLVSVLASPIFWFSADELASVRMGHTRISFFEALRLSEDKKVKNFLTILEKLRYEAVMNSLSVLIRKCFQMTRLDSIYASMSGGEARVANLRSFYQIAAEYEKSNLRTLGQFLEYLESVESGGLMTESGSTEGVTIMSIHKSKGLEFPVVFLCGLSHKFNMENQREQILCDKVYGIGMYITDMGRRARYSSVHRAAIAARIGMQSISEEIRVLYVAMTRARDRLVMTYAARNLAGQIGEIASGISANGGAMACINATCPGTWVLLSAMFRSEAGELHALTQEHIPAYVSDFPWKISLIQEVTVTEKRSDEKQLSTALPTDAERTLRQALSFHYSHQGATMAPSKQTATGRKGRFRDAEASENTAVTETLPRVRHTAGFGKTAAGGKEYGNAMHAVMQYIRYENCVNELSVEKEIDRLVQQQFISEEQRKLVNIQQIAAFFDSELGTKLVNGTKCLREFKFSILDDGKKYSQDLDGEQVLLQGVVDCALLERDGITILDFKTDHVENSGVAEVAERYRAQVDAYSEALSRIYEMPIKRRFLYLFRPSTFVEL